MLKRYKDKKVDSDWLNTNFPCMLACPAHTNAGRYVGLLAEGRFEEAYRIARDPNPLASICGRVCAHPCETACRRGEIDKPIAIRALKRFLTERHGPESKNPIATSIGRTGKKVPYKVAVVGGGPVGLSAAHDLALLGYSVTIFEASPVPGGMLYLGIPEYRLPRDVVEAQVREILETGDITLKLNHAAGRDFNVSDLRRQGFDAVLLAVGAHRSRDLSIPGVDLDGVHKGIDFLLNVNLGYKFTIGKKVIVIGGGNVAMDVARSAAREVVKQHASGVEDIEPALENVAAVAAHEMVDISLSALRMGAREVNIVCLEPRGEMPAALEEIEEAEAEGVILRPGLGPKRVVGKDGRVTALETLRTQRVFDENKRFNPAFYEGTESQIECDTIIMAIGQAPGLDFLKPEDKVDISLRGLISVHPKTLMTSAPGIFAGGDCVFGPRLIIDSVADGKRAAIGIDEYLRGHKHAGPVIEVEILKRHQMPLNFIDLEREPISMLPLEPATPEQIAHGKVLVMNYGCASCHQINGIKKPDNFAPELSRIGSKPITQLLFLQGMPHTLPDYISGKIKTPRAFAAGLKMPQFNFSPEQIDALTTVLLSLNDRARTLPPSVTVVRAGDSNYEPAGKAGQLMKDLACFSCHRINGRGGDLAPDLSFEGSAVQRSWLTAFLKNPTTLRPALIRRMPTFNLTDSEIKELSDYIMTVFQSPAIDRDSMPLSGYSAGEIEQGKQLFYSRYGCQACHIADPKADKGYIGPTLTAVGSRMNAAWIYAWLKDPQALRPGSMEPKRQMSDDDARALTAFLMSLKGSAKQVAKK